MFTEKNTAVSDIAREMTLRDSMLSALGIMSDVIRGMNNPAWNKTVKKNKQILDDLKKRTEEHRLPLQAVQVILNDVRLEATLVLTDVTLVLLDEHRQLLGKKDSPFLEKALHLMEGQISALKKAEKYLRQSEADIQTKP